MRDALATLPIVDLTIEEPPLEEVMRELFQRAAASNRQRPIPAIPGARVNAVDAAPPRPGVAAELASAARAFPTLLRIGVAEVVAYRAEFLVWILTTNMPLVMLALWHAVAADGPVGRFDQPSSPPTTWACSWCASLTSNWMAWQMSMEIRDGTLSAKLLRPIHPLYAFARRALVGDADAHPGRVADRRGADRHVVGPPGAPRSVGWCWCCWRRWSAPGC